MRRRFAAARSGAQFMAEPYPPTLAAAQARIAAVRPSAYARTRNAIDGAVSGLSPYITHGLVSPGDVLAGVAARHELAVQHKFVYELGWRAYFRHVWQHRGEDILRSLHDGPLPDAAYAAALPALPQGTLVLGLFVGDFHRAWPWSDRRWRFVDARMAELTSHRWHDNAAAIGAALAGVRRARSVDEPHLAPWLARWAECIAAPALFPQVARRCDSFSQWWSRASRGLQSAADLLAVNKVPSW